MLDEAVLGVVHSTSTEARFGKHHTYTDLSIATPGKRKRKIYTPRQLEYHDRVTEFNDAINAMTILIQLIQAQVATQCQHHKVLELSKNQ